MNEQKKYIYSIQKSAVIAKIGSDYENNRLEK